MACPVRVQERLRGGWHKGRSFEGRPREDSRVRCVGRTGVGGTVTRGGC
jgi:hypothetical protein